MITVMDTITLPDTYPLERLGSLDTLLFFDIETTGFSGDYSTLYLIGCTYFQDGEWHLIQWFADRLDSEEELLHEFFTFLDRFSVLVHFNGDGFDIPYLLKRCRHYGLTYDFSKVTSIDIYKRIKPYKSILQLESLKQKALEQFLGVERTDLYSGGQLIEVYKDYLITREDFLYDMLMLHNADDLKGMPSILPILNYPDFFEHDFTLVHNEILFRTDIFGTAHPFLELTWESDYTIPVPFEQSFSRVWCRGFEHRLTFSIELLEGSLKHFYSDYKNYYYLPLEDTAIHKSVGAYVDKDAKQKATAKNCYTKQSGRFLPQFKPIFTPYLQAEYKDKITYVLLKPELFDDADLCNLYLKHLILACR